MDRDGWNLPSWRNPLLGSLWWRSLRLQFQLDLNCRISRSLRVPRRLFYVTKFCIDPVTRLFHLYGLSNMMEVGQRMRTCLHTDIQSSQRPAWQKAITVQNYRVSLSELRPGLGWHWFGMFHHLAQKPSHFCQIPISPSRVGQTVDHLKSKSTKSILTWLGKFRLISQGWIISMICPARSLISHAEQFSRKIALQGW